MTQAFYKSLQGYDKLTKKEKESLLGWKPSFPQLKAMRAMKGRTRLYRRDGVVENFSGQKVCNMETIYALGDKGIIDTDHRFTTKYSLTGFGNELIAAIDRG